MQNSFGVVFEGKEERREKNKIENFIFDYIDYMTRINGTLQVRCTLE